MQRLRWTTLLIFLIPAVSAAARADGRKGYHTMSAGEERVPLGRFSVGLGIGSGGITGTDDEDASQGVASTVQLGYRFSPQWRLLLDQQTVSFARYRADPDRSQQQSSTTLAVVWSPFEPERRVRRLHLDLTSVHLKAGLGVGHMLRVSYSSFNPFDVEQGQWGLALTSGVGWQPIRSGSYALGLEATDSMAVYGDGRRHNFGLTMLATLEF